MTTKANYYVKRVNDEAIFLVDLDSGGPSVTNQAEEVVKEVLNLYGRKRVIYRDSDGRWDEMLHDNGEFTSFAPIKDDDTVLYGVWL